MEAPDILAFQVSDTPGVYGNIYDTGAALGLPYESWVSVSNPRDGGATENAMPIGIPQQYYKFDDLPSTGFVDRLSLRAAANYAITGGAGLTVTGVWFRQEENNQLEYSTGLDHGYTITQTITIYLKLASAPASGTAYMISNATAGITPINFTYGDKSTRAGGIRVSAGGHKPNDPFKIAYLCSRIPGNAAYGDPGAFGSLDFGAAPYSISSFQILDSAGTSVFTGSVMQRCAVTDLEKCAYFTGFIDDGTGGGSPSGVAGTKLTVTAITDGYILAGSSNYVIGGAGVAAGTYVLTNGTGGGGVGTYNLSGSAQLVNPAEQMWMTDAYGVGIDVADTSKPYSIAAITKGSVTTQITFSGPHDFVTGDGIRFRGISGMTQIEGSPGTAHAWISQKVTVVDSLNVTIPLNSSGYSNFTTGTYNTSLGGVENVAYKTFNTNRAGCAVYQCDYSSFAPAIAGNYYLYIPGWGISDPIPISTTQWAANASLHHKGIYNLRLGMALDGRAGFTRGVALLDGNAGLQNYWSNLPAIFSTESGTFNATASLNLRILSGMGAFTSSVLYSGTTWQPWGTTNRATGSRPGHQDAGDNDDLTIDHAPAWGGLAWVFEAIQNLKGAASCVTPFTVPLSSAVCDPTLFAGTDAAAPLWHEMVWWGESLRTMQNTNPVDTVLYGSVPGGYGIGHFSQQTANAPEPIDYYHGTDPSGTTPNHGPVGAFLYAPDHLSGLYVVQFFAKLAIISYAYGFASVGDAYKTAATLLYNWCQGIATNTTTRDAYYQTHLGLLATYTTQFGWTSTDYNTAMAKILTSYNNLLPSVQATMWRLSGINSSGVYPAAGAPTPDFATYGSPADAVYSTLVGKQGGWDYLFCSAYPSYNATHAAYIIGSHWSDTFQKGGAPNAISTKTSFANNNWNNFGGIYADFNNVLGHMAAVKSGASPSTSSYLKAINANFAFTYGANLRGRQYVVGQGPRSTVIVDHNDSIRLGQPSPTGILPFSFATSGWGTYSLGTFFNLGVGAGCDGISTWIASNTTGTNEANFGSKKMIEPWPQAQAGWEWSPQNYAIINICEYIQASLLSNLGSALWSHAWDGSHI